MAEAKASGLTVSAMPEDCNNAPRKMVIRDFLIALYGGDTARLAELLHADVDWQVIAGPTLTGADAAVSWASSPPAAKDLVIHTVITHGTHCGADGVVEFADGSRRAFNHVMLFAGHAKTAPIKTIRSYLIDL